MYTKLLTLIIQSIQKFPVYNKNSQLESIVQHNSCKSIRIESETLTESALATHYLKILRHLIEKGMGNRVIGPLNLKTGIKRWSVIKSPFIHKVSFAQYEKRYTKNIMTIKNINSQQLAQLIIWYILKQCPPGISFKFDIF